MGDIELYTGSPFLDLAMKLTYLNRIFIYSFTVTVLIGYMVTKDLNLLSILTHSLTAVFGAEVVNAMPVKQ